MKIYENGGTIRNQLAFEFHGMKLKDNDMDYVVVGTTEEAMLRLGYSKRFSDSNVPLFKDAKGSDDDYVLAQHGMFGADGYKEICTPEITIEQHLKRSDFALNSLARELGKVEIVDVNDGIKDIREKQVRHINTGVFKINPARVLRALRIALQLGFKLNRGTEELMMQPDIAQISHKHFTKEMKKAEKAGVSRQYIEALKKHNVGRLLCPLSMAVFRGAVNTKS